MPTFCSRRAPACTLDGMMQGAFTSTPEASLDHNHVRRPQSIHTALLGLADAASPFDKTTPSSNRSESREPASVTSSAVLSSTSIGLALASRALKLVRGWRFE